MFVSIRNNSNLKSIICRIAHSQTNTIYGNRTFINRHITTLCHLLVKLILKGIITATIHVLDADTFRSLIYMPLHDVSVQTSVHHHTTLHIHFIPYLQQSKVGTLQCFFNGSYCICTILNAYHCQTNTIVSNTLIYLQFVYKRTFQCKVQVSLFFFQTHYFCIFFYNS